MQTRYLNILALAIVILFASCNKSNTQGRYIPKEAAFVIQLDGKTLSAKLPWEEIKQNPAFKDADGDSTIPSAMKGLLNNPDSAGIDTRTDLLFFAQKDSMGGYSVFEGTIKNQQLFKTFNKQLTENGAESEKDGVSYISKSPVCVGFTKDKFVYIFDAPEMSRMDALSKGMQQDSIDVTPPKPRDISATCKAIFDLSEGNSLAKNEKFGKLMKEAGDIHVWINTEELTKQALTNPMLSMVNLDKFYKGSVTTASISFEAGKITAFAKSYVGDDLANVFKKYGGGKISEDMIKRIPGKDIVGLFVMNFKPEGIKELLKLSSLDGLANMGLTNAGFTLDDFIKANKGDILFGASDLKLTSDTAQQESSAGVKPEFNFVFATSIGDKDAFNKLINAGKKLGPKESDDSIKAPFAYNSNGTYFTIANSKENANKYLAGTSSNFDFINKINGQPMGGYLNLQILIRTLEREAAKDSSAKVVYDASIQLWDNVMMKGGDFTDGAITQTVEVNMMDKTTNSLKQLNQYANKLGEVYKAKKNKEKAIQLTREAARTAENPSVLEETK